MKSVLALWALIAVIVFFQAGFIPAVIVGVLVAASNVKTGLHAAEIGSTSSYKSLR